MIHEGRGNHIRLNNAGHPAGIVFIRPPECFGKFRQFIDPLQGLWIEHPVGVFFVDYAEHDSIAEVKAFL